MNAATIDFSELFRRYSADVHRYVYWSIGHAADAQDITAETFARAFAGADGLRAETVKAYLLTIARNLCAERARRARPQDALDDEIADAALGPERTALLADENRRLLACLQRLPEIDRSALLLHAYDGLDQRLVAAMLGLTPGAVKVRIHRARLRLAQLLETPP